MDSSDRDNEHNYPPDLSDECLIDLISHIKVDRLTHGGRNEADEIQDWQMNHGSLLKLVSSESEHSVLSRPVGVSCFPSLFPRAQFEHALRIQEIYNHLYCSIAEDPEWIFTVIQDLIPVEPLAKALWGIYEAVRDAGSVQNLSVGIFRSDYMLHLPDGQSTKSPDLASPCPLRQVEFNTFSCAGPAHANKVADMHRYLARTGLYTFDEQHFDVDSIPVNQNIESLASCLAFADLAYGPPKSTLARQTAVLFIVQPNNFNTADERPLEYALWNRAEPVPAYRLEFGPGVLEYTWLTDHRELLFHPPWLASKHPVEISVIYMRAGYEAAEYDSIGWDARFLLEKSAAIKCPSILSHLATFKKVQQALTVPGALERFLSESEAATIRETFMPMYPLDETEAGRSGRVLACDVGRSGNYILKPSLEGGGHNIYGDAIPRFLSSIPESQWSRYILMERIKPPMSANVLMGPGGIDAGEVVSELGVLGCCLWKAKPDNSGCEVLHNTVGGWTFKTKYAEVDEMSVVKGFGCFDTPRLTERLVTQ